MGRITLQQAAQWCGGRIDPKYADVVFCGANIDSRSMEPGQMFVALQGVRDGHDFIPMALEKGAAAVLCTHCDGDYPAIVVEDTRLALGDIARGERQKLGMKVVGVTGSVGKSTTKEMIACVLGSTYRTGRSPVNYNNDLGLPMSILSLPEDTEVAVLEMGMNHFREIAYLTSIAKPDVAVIINIGTMHIEHLGSMEGILQAKLEILEGVPEEGKVILNGDDQLLWNAHRMHNVKATYFGVQNTESTILGSHVTEEAGRLCYDVQCGQEKFTVMLPLEGQHFVLDSLAAVSVGLAMGVSPEKIRSSLAEFQNMAGRQEVIQAKGYTIIKDCYNAGPESMAAALAVLGNKPGRHVAVLGDMLELGVCAQAEHYRVGRIAAEKAEIVLAYGPNGSRVINGALTGGMPDSRAKAFEDRKELVAALKRLARPGDVILFKGSHGMHMELALELFLKDDET
ncbi:MAG: UDP-N-acetylmuramoyl-tripeptide--D-alanyl-D-alanine ligase [Oscillospiraceae bacterium]|nr:UDP-N-acetylmuramoyl-tripeptide--D-alanyl-D-alanine ligase [Oscillospiraceae bacterium]